MTQDEIIRMAREAGFDEDDCGLSGNSELDETIYVAEYPIGEAVFKLVALAVEAERQRTVEILMELHRKANGQHNYYHFAANEIMGFSV